MYAPVSQQEGAVEHITNQPNWRGDIEREYQKYVDPAFYTHAEDLPRSATAPPHLQNRLVPAADVHGRGANLEVADSLTDIRYDEDYPAFYEMNADKCSLPPPIDGDTLYKDMQTYLAAQRYADHSGFPAAATQYQLSPNPFRAGIGGQASLRSLETVQEQQYDLKKSTVDEHLAAALNQLQVGSEIQRPGSQPAPNLLQAAIAAGAGHIRSASAFPRFEMDSFAMSTGGVPSATSSPAPGGSFSSVLPHSSVTQSMSGQLSGGPVFNNPLDMHAAAVYRAAYEAALIQTQNDPQINPQIAAMQQPGVGMPDVGFGTGLQTQGLKTDMQPLPQRGNQPSVMLGASRQGPQQDIHYNTGSMYEAYEDPPAHRDEPRRSKRYNRRERERDMNFNSADAYYDSQFLKFNSIEEVVGQVIQVAQDQNGCRFLQRKFDEGGAQTIALVFPEILENIMHLMKDPFGNYLIQKLLDRCTEDQRTQVVRAVAEKGELVPIALSTHGTRAVQKLIETLTTKEQRTLAIAALKPGVVHLIKDLNGNHVVQRCLQRLGPEDSQFIYDAAIGCCVEIASHRHGCCVLQRCIDFATHEQRTSMIMEISANALVLSQDAFGNYVVQYVLDLGQAEASQQIMNVLLGHYSELAVQKFSSNVVEKCLKLGGLDDARENIIRELMQSPRLPRLLQDPYGNYVIQSALTVTSGSLHQSLVEAIQPYLPTLRGTPHGKRILQKVLASLKDPFQP